MADSAGWYGAYPTESESYVPYSEVASSSEIFTYEHVAYNSDSRIVFPETSEGNQHYTQLVNSGPVYSHEYYHQHNEYNPSYNSFNQLPHGYVYNFANTVYDTCAEEITNYSHAERNIGASISGFSPIINDAIGADGSSSATTISSASVPDETPKIETSSSSEEDALEMSRSLATIVKETMVSV